MINVLLITGIGMGLVFVVIVLLWGMMELLVRVFADKQKPDAVETTSELPEQSAEPVLTAAPDKQKIAALAVATALQIRRRQAAVNAVQQALAIQKQNLSTSVENSQPSNWQAVMRSVQRQNRQELFTRTRNVR